MKKISILSYINTHNYGGQLQCFALQKFLLANTEFNVEHINYKQPMIYEGNLLKKILKFSYNKIILPIIFNKKRRNNEKLLLSKMNISKSYRQNNIAKINTDAVIVGSDQVWNPNINHNDTNFLLPFYKGVKISYACSFGTTYIDRFWETQLIKNLNNFKNISLRESDFCDYIEKFIGCSTIVDLDPVFLLSRDEWEKCETTNLKEKYALVYLMPGDKKLENYILETAEKYATENHIKLVVIGCKEIDKFKNHNNIFFQYGPLDFVGLVNHSEIVFTNSFHGTAFSLIFEKIFYSFVNTNTDVKLYSRIINILNICNLENRILDLKNKFVPNYHEGIDYKTISKKINFAICQSKEHLLNSLKF